MSCQSVLLNYDCKFLFFLFFSPQNQIQVVGVICFIIFMGDGYQKLDEVLKLDEALGYN